MSNRSVRPQGRQRFSADGYEKRDANAKWIFGVVGFLLVAGLLTHFCMAGVMDRFKKKPPPQDRWSGTRREIAGTSESKAVPHLQIAPAEDLKKFREREDAELNTYGWIDRTAGVVRVPVDRAMELVLQRGLQVLSGTNGLGPSAYELQQQRSQFAKPEDK